MKKAVVIAIAGLHFVLAAWFAKSVLESAPHTPDSAVYYRMGILLGDGRLGLEGYPEPAAAFRLQGAVERDGRVVFHFQHFWPALLAAPIRLGVADLLNPLLGALSVVAISSVGRRLFDSRVGLVAALLLAVSPLAIILDGSFMLHTSTLCCLLAFMVSLLAFAGRPSRIVGLAAGAALGGALALRQLTTVAVVVPILVYVLSRHGDALRRRETWWIALGFAPLAALLMLDNAWITGNPFVPPHEAFNHHGPRWSSLPIGADHVDALLGALPPILFSTSIPMLGLALAAAAVLASRGAAAELLLGAIFVSLAVAHLWVDVHGLHGYGPRLLFEGTFALFLLIARVGVRAWDAAGPAMRAALLALALVPFLQNLVALAQVLPSYRHYNGIDTRLLSALRELDPERSLVITGDSKWQGLDVAATLFDPDYERLVVLRELPDGSHLRALERFPGRRLYRVEGQRLVPADRVGR